MAASEPVAASAPSVASAPRVCPGHSRPISELCYSGVTPDGVFFVSGCLDKLPMLRNGDNGDWIGTFEGHKGAVWATKLNAEATRVATGSADFTARLWDALSGTQLHAFEHKHIVKAVEFSADSKRLLTGSNDKVLRMFDLEHFDAAPVEMKHTANIRKVLWGTDGRSVLTGCEDGAMHVWDLASGAIVKTVPFASQVMDLEMSRNGSVVTVAAGRQVAFLDAHTYDLRLSHALSVDVEAASLHPIDGARFIAGGADMWVRVFDVASGAELSCQKGHHGPVHAVRFHPSGTSYISGSEDGTIRLWATEAAPAK